VQLRRRRALGLASRRRQFEGQAITASVRLETLGFHADRPETANTLRRYAVARTVLGIRMAMWVAVKETQNAVLRAYVYPPPAPRWATVLTGAAGTATAWRVSTVEGGAVTAIQGSRTHGAIRPGGI
jgi:hypothetical protein